MADENQAYLGDGVYAKFDEMAQSIVLDLRGQDDFTFIALEESVFDGLVKWGNEKFGKTEPQKPDKTAVLASVKAWMEDCMMDRGMPGLPSRVQYDKVCKAIKDAAS